MKIDDYDRFSAMWSVAWENSGKTVSPTQIELAFTALQRYEIDVISRALSDHLLDPVVGQYGPRPADIVRQIEGVPPGPDEIIAAARLAKTPIGVLARIYIGSWNLNNWDSYQLKPLAHACIQQLPEWKHRISRGCLSQHESEMMEKYEVSDLRNMKINHTRAREFNRLQDK